MRSERYRDLLPIDRISAATVGVIGVSAIGRQVAIQLAAMGTGRLRLIDHDTVEPVNLGTQGFRERDVGRSKAQAAADACRELCHECVIETHHGRFEVIEHLGSGSEADVYAVTDRAAGEMRCVKRSAASSADPACATLRERFRRVGTLRTGCHGVLDPLELIDGEDLLIVFPLIDGCDLDAFVSREGGHLHKRAAAAIDLQILSAVLQLGQAGFIHRDLKPLNVLVGRDHCVRIIDLGAAARAGECLSASFIGTTPWCAPEQHRDPEGVTTAADLFASGLIGAWLYTSQHPYPFEEPDAFLRAADRGVPAPPRQRDEMVDAGLRLIQPRLDPEPAARTARTRSIFEELFDAPTPAAVCMACGAPASPPACATCGRALSSAVGVRIESPIAGTHLVLVPVGDTEFGRRHLGIADPYISRRQFELRSRDGSIAIRDIPGNVPTRLGADIPTDWSTLTASSTVRFGKSVARIVPLSSPRALSNTPEPEGATP